MTKPELLERLAVHRQALDETYRAIVIRGDDDPDPSPANERLAYRYLTRALACIQGALDAYDRPSQSPAQPWIGELPPAVDPAFRTTELRVQP